jgi:hypothetical protein
VRFAALVALLASSCCAHPATAPLQTVQAGDGSLTVVCISRTDDAGTPVVDIEIKNVRSRPIYVLSEPDLPFKIPQADGSLTLFVGIDPPTQAQLMTTHYAVAPSRFDELAPGDGKTFTASLTPLYPTSYWGLPHQLVQLHGAVRVNCDVAYTDDRPPKDTSVEHADLKQHIIMASPFDVNLR